MTANLVPIELGQLPTSIGSEDTFDEIAQGADFLGRLELRSKAKTDSKGKTLIEEGHYCIPISADEAIDLGETVDIIPLARRPKAIDMNDRPVISVYDETSEEFQRIRAASEVKDSGCQFGPSFLIIERTTGRLLEYFLGAPTHRPEAKKIYPNLPVNEADIERLRKAGKDVSEATVHGPIPLTLYGKFIKKEKFSWWVPQIRDCSAPFTKLPKPEKINAEVIKFLAAKTELEVQEQQPAGKQKRAR